MTHLIISGKIVGDTMTAVGIAIKVAKSLNESMIIQVKDGEWETVQPDSNIIELSRLIELGIQMRELKKNKK